MSLRLPLRTILVLRITGKSAGNNSTLIISIQFRRDRGLRLLSILKYG
jgi:hypothetical protein